MLTSNIGMSLSNINKSRKNIFGFIQYEAIKKRLFRANFWRNLLGKVEFHGSRFWLIQIWVLFGLRFMNG